MKTLFTLLVLFLAQGMFCQIVNDMNKVTVALKDGTKITLYGKAYGIGDKTRKEVVEGGVLVDSTNAKDGHYYYLPTNLHLSKNDNGIPQFLLLKYMADEETPERDMSGAIMHFLMEWGLTEDQKNEAEQLLKELRPDEKNPKILGPLTVETPQGESFQITSATASDPGFNNTGLIATGNAPVVEGGKVAVASNFNKYGAQLIGTTFEKESGESSVSDLSVTLAFNYTTKLPALKGRVIFDWSKIDYSRLSEKSSFTKKGEGTGKYKWRGPSFAEVMVGSVWPKLEEIKAKKDSYEYRQSLFEILSQEGILTMELEENINDERLAPVRDAVLNIFMSSIDRLFQDALEQESEEQSARLDKEADINRADARKNQNEKIKKRSNKSYQAQQKVTRFLSRRGSQVIELNYGLSVTRSFTVTENIMSWYSDIERYNDACISKVILNDPFFQRLRIQFILDRDMVDIFEQEVNYATVNVRKKRNDGHDFTSRVTLDDKYIEENGVQAAVTYAAGEDKNADMYEYQVQYSFRGGNVFPERPKWTKGTMEAVTLYPPIKMHNVEFESDLTTMTDFDIARATMQIRYMKLGEEHQVNIPVSPAKEEPLVSKAIFMDQNMKGFAYRIIYDHKTEGKLATEWNAKLGAIDYLYAPIPEEFRDTNSEVFKKAKSLGDVLAPSDTKAGKVASTVLESFKVLFE